MSQHGREYTLRALSWARAAARAWPLWAFPVMVWIVGSLFLLGDLGKLTDDYAAHWRDPVTGGFAWGDLLRYPWWFFWRPVHVQLVYTLQTLLWNQDWANHLFSAAMHALACVSAWSFVRDAGVRGWIAVGVLVLLLAATPGYEAIFWPATVSTSIGAAGLFLAAKIVLRFAQGRHSKGGPWVLAGLGVLVPCCYEQPAAAMSMLPIVYVAGMLDRERLSERVRVMSMGRHALRMIGVLAPVALGILAYLTLFAITVRQDPFARESQLAVAEGFMNRVQYLVQWYGKLLDPTYGFGPAFQAGIEQWAAARWWELGVLVLAVLSGIAWVMSSTRVAGAAAGTRRGVMVLIAVFAASAMMMGLVPVIAIRGAGLSSRLMYLPTMCALVGLAALAEAWVRSFHGKKGLILDAGRGLTLGGSAIAAALGCVVLVGVQSMYQKRHAQDMASLRDLVERLSSPRPGTVFVPVRMALAEQGPTTDRLRQSLHSIWQSPWAINTMIKHAYRRKDVHATTIYAHNQSNAIFRMGVKTRLTWSHFFWSLPTPRTIEEYPEFENELVVPIGLDARGMVESIDRMVVTTPGGERLEFPVHQRLAQRASDIPAVVLPVSIPIDDGGVWQERWTWTSVERAGSKVKFLRTSAFGAAEPAVRMHPPTPGVKIAEGDTDAMVTELPASDRARTMVFWCAFDEATIDLSALGDGVDVIWTIDGVGEVARATIDPKVVQRERRWIRVVVEIPAGGVKGAGRQLRVVVGPGAAGNNSYDRVLVSCGSLMPPE